MGHLMKTMDEMAAKEERAASDQASLQGGGEFSPAEVATAPVVSEQPPLRETGICALPDIGDPVVYHPRPGEVMRGRQRLAALVTARNEETRMLEMIVVRDAADVLTVERVPEWNGRDRGWEAKGAAVLIAGQSNGVDQSEELTRLFDIVLGEFEAPPKSILEMLDSLDRRIDALIKMKHVAPVAKKAQGARGKRK